MASSYRCADASADRDEEMVATASHVRGWVLIEVRGAWGEDAIHSSALGEHVPSTWKDRLNRRQIRAVCVRSHLRDDSPGVRLFACAARRPGRGPAPLWQREVGSLGDVFTAVDELQVDRSPLPASGWTRRDERLILVCTNGRHDQCCANLGRPLVRALRESRWADRVWECSHIGGDRFAANIVVLPDSLYFGRVDPSAAPTVLDALDHGRIALPHFRGRTSFSLAEQAVEHFVRRDLAISAVDGVVIDRRAADGTFPVSAGGRSVSVRVRRRMVSISDPLTCHGRPDQIVPTFSLVSIE